MKTVRALRNGQVTIPIEFRRTLGINDDTLLQMSVTDDGELRVRPLTHEETTGSPWLKELYDYFAPVRAEAEAKGLSESEIDATIDAAVQAVRERRA